MSFNFPSFINGKFGTSYKEASLLYKAKTDGFDNSIFHDLCDDKGPTFTVVRFQNGITIGAFTDLSWNGNGSDYTNSSRGFLYNFNRNTYYPCNISTI
jgi:hypothetical protein